MCWTAKVQFPGRCKIVLYSTAGMLSPEVKHQRHDADHSPPPSAKVKKGGAIPPLPCMSSWHSG
jgi:hypothetical protein